MSVLDTITTVLMYMAVAIMMAVFIGVAVGYWVDYRNYVNHKKWEAVHREHYASMVEAREKIQSMAISEATLAEYAETIRAMEIMEELEGKGDKNDLR